MIIIFCGNQHYARCCQRSLTHIEPTTWLWIDVVLWSHVRMRPSTNRQPLYVFNTFRF